jgi:hypothetical protein
MQRNKYVNVQPFYVNSPTPGELWDETTEVLVNDSNFGINLQFSIQCDISNWLCQNTNVFAGALMQQVTVELLNQMAFSLRSNTLKERAAQLAASALDNQEGGQHGEAKKLTQAIAAMSFDLSRVNSICLPCDTRNTVKMSSVWEH